MWEREHSTVMGDRADQLLTVKKEEKETNSGHLSFKDTQDFFSEMHQTSTVTTTDNQR